MNTIAANLIRIAVRIGRWIIERLAAKGLSLLLGYMDGKIDDFKRRLGRARTERRKRWLGGRIARWTKAMQWLRTNAAKVGKQAVDNVCAMPELKKLPVVAACEKEAA